MIARDRHSLRQTMQRIFQRRQQKRPRAVRRFEVMESRLLLAADLSSALYHPPLIELHGEYANVSDSSALAAEGEGALVAEGEASLDLVAFAKALAASGTRFFSAAWCPHCKTQRELFEDGANFLQSIEVTNLDSPVTLNAVGRGEDLTLNPSGVPISSFPTWEFPDGTRLTGTQSLETLSQRSGVPIPSSDQPFIAPINNGDKTNNAVDADGDQIVTLLAGSPLHIVLDGYDPGGGPLTYTVTSSNSNVSTTLLSGNKSMLIDVAGWGKMTFQLFEQRAPRPAERLIDLAESGFYDGITFHRIVDGFVIQGGDPTGTGSGGSTLGDFDYQFHVELQQNRTGVLSFAKSFDDTNDSQFFITEVATRTLDGNHSVVGILVEGDSVREAISNNSTTNPRTVTMESVDIVTDNENAVVMLKAAPGTTGSSTITVTATDASGNQFTRNFTVNVQPDLTDTLPWMGDFGDLTVAAGQTLSAQIPIIDVEGDPAQFGVVTPTNFTVTVPTGPVTSMANITITPKPGFIGSEDITFYVADTDLNLAGTVITNGILQSNSTLFDVQTITVHSEAAATGTVTGTVFIDQDRDGVLDVSESGVSGIVVFSDANGDGIVNAGEVSATTSASGAYSLVLPPGQHTIRQQSTTNTLHTTPNPVAVTVTSGGTASDVRFGNFLVTAPTSVDLLPATDSGNNSDNITNFDNSTLAKALQFQINGVIAGATVRLFADGTLLGQGTASGNSINITTNGTSALANGTRSIIATQELTGVVGPASPSLTVTIDTVLPGEFTSSPPAGAIVNQNVSYDVNSQDEGSGVTYSLVGAPTGATINATTGVLSWVPTASQLGLHEISVVVSDVAGNSHSQALSLRVTNEPIVGATFKITADANPNSAEIGSVSVGEDFFLHVFVSDLRDNAQGTFAFFQDIKFDAELAIGRNITYSPTFQNTRSGTISAGEIDEVGAVNFDITGVGAGSFHIFSVEFTAAKGGTLHLVGDAPDIHPDHDILVLGVNQAISVDEVAFGAAQLTIQAGFGANDDIFNFDEDTTNNVLNVLANDSSLSGSTGNLTITSVSPQLPGLSIATDGKSLRYTPPADFNGEVTFAYSVTDGVDTLSADVIVQVHPINDPPVAVNDAVTINTGSNNNFVNVLANDTDVDGDQLRVQSVGQLSGSGTIAVASGGAGLVYTPGPGFVGVDTVTYTITDNNGGTAQATVTLTVTGAGSDLFTVNEESQNHVFDVLVNDIGTGLTITSVGTRTHGGLVTIIENGTKLNYSRPANDNFFGTDTFTYTTTNSTGQVSTATVIVTVVNTNDPPTAANDQVTVTVGSSGNILNVLANDSNAPDPPGETLTVVSVNNTGTLGTVTVVDGTVRYTPPATFPGTNLATGTDTFTYTLGDGSGLTSQATVTVSVVEFVPGSLSGFVYIDANDNGIRETTEEGFEGITINLTGTNSLGNSVTRQAVTGTDGAYSFANLAPGNYVINQVQPTGMRNGMPIVDGKDTIGTQGGTVSANDQFTIVLTEGTAGGNNNFGELLGRTISGSIHNGAVNTDLLGVTLELVSNTSENPVRTVRAAGGTFSISGLAPGEYNFATISPTFLLPTSSTNMLLLTAAADSTNNQITLRGRDAAFISLRDISTAAPTQYAHVAIGTTGDEWYSLGRGWEGVTDADFTLTGGGNTVHIEITETSGQKLATDVARNDARIRIIGQSNDMQLLQFQAGRSAFNFQVVTANSGGASGEGASLAAAEGESSSSFVTSAGIATMLASSQLQAEGEGFVTTIASPITTHATALAATNIGSPTTTLANVDVALHPTTTWGLSSDLSDDLDENDSLLNETMDDEMRFALLTEVADEYGDSYRYGASSGSQLDAGDTETLDGIELLPADLLEQLAQDVAYA